MASFFQRNKDAYINGAKFGSAIGLTAGILAVLLAPAVVPAGLGGVLMVAVLGWFAGGIAGAALFGGGETIASTANAVVHPLSNTTAAAHAERAKHHAKTAHRKARRAEQMEMLAEHSDLQRRTNHAEAVSADRLNMDRYTER